MGSNGQAQKGGELGVNGEFYRGGQFMPVSARTIKGSLRISKGSRGASKQLVEPGILAFPPEGCAAIFGPMREFAVPVNENFQKLERSYHSDEVIRNYGWTPKKLQAQINAYNSGERWVKKST